MYICTIIAECERLSPSSLLCGRCVTHFAILKSTQCVCVRMLYVHMLYLYEYSIHILHKGRCFINHAAVSFPFKTLAQPLFSLTKDRLTFVHSFLQTLPLCLQDESRRRTSVS